MKEFKVSAAESGQKCIKYCEKILPNAGTGFLHKMLRKKNITLNGKKTDGSERLTEGDVLRSFTWGIGVTLCYIVLPLVISVIIFRKKVESNEKDFACYRYAERFY